jgi:hypothetical protein
MNLLKTIVYPSLIIGAALISLSFTESNKKENPKDELCYDFYIKCKGSNQFTETVKAKSLSVAKTMLTNRYPSCTVQTKSTNGHKCE